MLKFVRLLAFAELIGGAVWLWPAVFPRSVTPQDYVDSYPSIPVEPTPVAPYPGLILIGAGTLTLAQSCARQGAP